MPQQSVKQLSQNELEAMQERYVSNMTTGLYVRFQDWRGFPVGAASEYGIGHTGKNWSIPVYDKHGKLVTIRFRRDEVLNPGDGPKYWGVAGHNSESLLYGVHSVKRGRSLVLVEGEFDTIAAQLAGLPAVNFINGVGLKDDRRETLERIVKHYDYLFLMFDQDEAAERAITGFQNNQGKWVDGYRDAIGLNWGKVVVVKWPVKYGKDPAEVYQKLGYERARKALPYFVKEAWQTRQK